jgi:hypothetical protein
VVFTPSLPVATRPAEATGLVLRGYEGGTLTWEAEADRGEIGSPASALSNVALRIFDGSEATARVTARSLTEAAGT